MVELILFVVLLCLASVVFVVVKFNIDYTKCDKKYTVLQQTYENETKPLQLQIADFKTRTFEAEDRSKTLSNKVEENLSRIALLEKNVIGKFEREPLVANGDRTCVSIADATKGDFSYLQLNTLCKEPDRVKIFSYDPVYKQIIMDLGQQKRCIDAVNENDIVINECLRTSQKQKFNYFPLYGGRFKSMLYNKCIGFNPENNILELQTCNDNTNVMTRKDKQQSHLFLENN